MEDVMLLRGVWIQLEVENVNVMKGIQGMDLIVMVWFFSFSYWISSSSFTTKNHQYWNVDINECMSNNGGCDELSEGCTNTIGSRECYCLNGFLKSNENCIGMFHIFLFSFIIIIIILDNNWI